MIVAVNKRVLKIVFILFVILFCVYLIPRIAINFFITRTIKFMAPIPGLPNQ